MTKPEWGNKHICGNCAARFYDMKQDPATCPKCGTVSAPTKLPTKAQAVEPDDTAAAKPSSAPASDESDDVEDEEGLLLDDDDDDDDLDDLDDDDDDALMEDASDLSEVDDDLLEAKEHMDTDTV